MSRTVGTNSIIRLIKKLLTKISMNLVIFKLSEEETVLFVLVLNTFFINYLN